VAKGKGLSFTHPTSRTDEKERYETIERLKRLPRIWGIKVLGWRDEGLTWKEIIRRLPQGPSREATD
jgi:hypothetical protein